MLCAKRNRAKRGESHRSPAGHRSMSSETAAALAPWSHLESLMSPSHAIANCLRPATCHASWLGSRLALLAHRPESQERRTPCSRTSPASSTREGHFEARAAQAAQAGMLQELGQRRSGGPHRVLAGSYQLRPARGQFPGSQNCRGNFALQFSLAES